MVVVLVVAAAAAAAVVVPRLIVVAVVLAVLFCSKSRFMYCVYYSCKLCQYHNLKQNEAQSAGSFILAGSSVSGAGIAQWLERRTRD